jgi:hypothetical protein
LKIVASLTGVDLLLRLKILESLILWWNNLRLIVTYIHFNGTAASGGYSLIAAVLMLREVYQYDDCMPYLFS